MRNERDDFCRGLRELATFFEDHPLLPIPFTKELSDYLATKKEMSDIARTSTWKKKYTNGFFHLSKTFHNIVLKYSVSRGTVCDRKVLRTEWIPERTIKYG